MATEPTVNEAAGREDREWAMVPLERIQVHPLNLRRELRGLDELADSIRENGLLEPVLLVPAEAGEDQYVLIAGHRRHAACVMARHDPIEAVIRRDLSSEGAQVIAMLTENGPRDNLTPIEEAHGYQLALGLNHLTPARLAKKLGKPKATIASRIALTRLPDTVQDRVHDHQISLQDAEVLVEFAGDPKALDALLVHVGTQSLAYQVTVQRRAREVAERIAQAAREIAKTGVRVIERPVEFGWRSRERSVSDFVDPSVPASDDGAPVRFTAEAHAAVCQFHAAFVNGSTYEPELVCTDPEQAGHVRFVMPSRPVVPAAGASPARRFVVSAPAAAEIQAAEDEQRRQKAEADAAEARRREALEVAARMRRSFLSTLVRGKGRDRLVAILRLLCGEHFEAWLEEAEVDDARQLGELIEARLTSPPDESESADHWDSVVTDLRAALSTRRSPDAIAGALLAIVAHDREDALTHGHGWENPACTRYVSFLIGQGYEPTEIEAELLGGDATA